MSYYNPELNELTEVNKKLNLLYNKYESDKNNHLLVKDYENEDQKFFIRYKDQLKNIKCFKKNDENLDDTGEIFTTPLNIDIFSSINYFLAKQRKNNNYIIGKLIQKNKFNDYYIYKIYADIIVDGEEIKAIYNDKDDKYYKSHFIGDEILEKFTKKGGKKQRKSMKSKKSRKIKNKKSRKSYSK